MNAKKHHNNLRMDQVRSQIFIAHEFSRDMMDDLRQSIDTALQGSGLSSYYADNELYPNKQVFIDKIIPRIHLSAFGIYDITNPSKTNIFLELGAGLALGRICVIICKKGTIVPSNLLGLDRIEYDSFKDLSGQLRDKTIPFWPQW